MNPKLYLMTFLLIISLASVYPSGYQEPKLQGTPGSGLMYSNGRVVYYQHPWASYGSGVYQKRIGTNYGPAYNPFPMPNTDASGRKGGYSSYIFLDDQLAYNYYSHPELLQPRYMTNNWRYMKAEPYSYGLIGPNRDKRTPLIRASVSTGSGVRLGFLT